jgi:DNA-binding response OmpR family regulator
MRVVFGDCTLDSETREFLRGRAPVHLSPKAFRMLELLLEKRPRARETILGRDASASVLIDDGTVSRRHARVTVAGAEAL